MAVSEPEKYAERMTRITTAPDKVPNEESSKNGEPFVTEGGSL
jgi:hypothetical protein